MSRWFGDSDIGRSFSVQIVHVLPAELHCTAESESPERGFHKIKIKKGQKN